MSQNHTKSKGRKHSEETKQKLRDKMMERREKYGYIVSPETREKIREAAYNKKHSEEVREKMSQAHKKYHEAMTFEEEKAWREARSKPCRDGIKEYWRKVKAGEIKRKVRGQNKEVFMKDERVREENRNKDIGRELYYRSRDRMKDKDQSDK